jgi:hypothetical protein
MNTRSRTAFLATTVVAVLASIAPSAHAWGNGIGAPPIEPAACAPAEPGGEIIHSWSLSPGGSLAADQAAQRPELAYELAQGAVQEDSVILSNLGTEQLTFRVYATDAFNNADGQFDLLSGEQPPTDVGSWVTLAQELITVPACKQVTIPITINVPADAAPGDHAGAILASSESIGTGPEGSAVTLDRRTGTRLYLRVGGALIPDLAVVDVDTTYHHALSPLGGSATVSYTVENRGNVRMGGTASMTVGGPFGLGEQTVTLPDVPELLPGESVSVTTEVDDVPAAFVSFTSVKVVTAGGGEDASASVSGDDTTFTPPISILIVLLVVILGVLLRRTYRRHQGDDDDGDVESSNSEPVVGTREPQPA